MMISIPTNTHRTEALRASLATAIARHTVGVEQTDTAIVPLSLYRRDAPTAPAEHLVEPSIALVVQGRKRMVYGQQEYLYDPQQYLITSLDLPGTASILEASADAPYLGLALRLDLRLLTEVMIQLPPQPREPLDSRAMVLGEVTEPLLDALNRLVVLLDDPTARPVLAPLIQQEIYYRLLASEQGGRLRQIASVGSQSHRISTAIRWLTRHFTQPLRVDELATRAQMSASTFHTHFRQLTHMSPLQFQKWLRLNEARRLILSQAASAADAAFQVGYESPSQFNREYKRQFGVSPGRDAEALRGHSGFTEVAS